MIWRDKKIDKRGKKVTPTFKMPLYKSTKTTSMKIYCDNSLGFHSLQNHKKSQNLGKYAC